MSIRQPKRWWQTRRRFPRQDRTREDCVGVGRLCQTRRPWQRQSARWRSSKRSTRQSRQRPSWRCAGRCWSEPGRWWRRLWRYRARGTTQPSPSSAWGPWSWSAPADTASRRSCARLEQEACPPVLERKSHGKDIFKKPCIQCILIWPCL